MKHLILIGVYCASFSLLKAQSEPATLIPLNLSNIQSMIAQVPEKGDLAARGKFMIISLPMPEGHTVDFYVKHDPLVSRNSPLYRTTAGKVYSLQAVQEAGYNGSMVVYADGIHATLHTPHGLLFVRRTRRKAIHEYVYFNDTEGFPHDPGDAVRPETPSRDNSLIEHQHSDQGAVHTHAITASLANNNFFSVGGDRNVLDLFVLSEKGFTDQYGGDIGNATARVVEIVAGVRTIWEQDFNVTINYMGVYFSPNSVAGSIPNSIALFTNEVTDAQVTNGTKADVDLAHFFAGNGGGGAAQLWSACDNANKAGGYSGSNNVAGTGYIPLIAHEMAHHMGADHTWTGVNGSCTTSQYGYASGVEPGAGISLASYAGICGTDNIPNGAKSDFHHTESIREIVTFVRNGTGKTIDISGAPAPYQIPGFPNFFGGGCFATSAFANNTPVVNSNPNNLTNLNIPARTPFELTGSATDGDGDPLTYQWDDLNFASGPAALDAYVSRPDGPLFRSFGPENNPSRMFPQLNDILSGVQTGGEILPQTSRKLRFALTVRDGKGGVGIDTIGLNVVDSGTGFAINEPVNTANPGNVNLTWEVANTAAAPINCANVDIRYSTDGGQTFPYLLAANTPNDGSHTVDISQFNTTQGRIKIQAASSIFFDINNTDINVANGACSAQPSTLCAAQTIDANSGDAALNLDASQRLIVGPAITSKTLTITGNQGDSPVYSGPNTCAAASYGEYHSWFTFNVSETGAYTFSDPPDFGSLTIFQTDNYAYSPNDPCGNFTFLDANFDVNGNGRFINVTFQKCVTYTAVVSNYQNNFQVTININGPGTVYENTPLAGGTTYSYVAINTANDLIAKVDAIADFRSLTNGSYRVYGFTYNSNLNPAGWVGQTAAATFTLNTCAVRSNNWYLLNVTGGGNPQPCQNQNVTNNANGNTNIAPGTYQGSNLTSAGIVKAPDAVTFKASTSITLNPGFAAQNGCTFVAQIEGCPNSTAPVVPPLELASIGWQNALVSTAKWTPETSQPYFREKKSFKAAAHLEVMPNPGFDQTSFFYQLSESGPVNITVYDVEGKIVTTLIDDHWQEPGSYQLAFQPPRNGKGVFLVVLQTEKKRISKRFVIM